MCIISNGTSSGALSTDSQFAHAVRFLDLMSPELGIARIESSLTGMYVLWFGGEYVGIKEGVSLEHAVLLLLQEVDESKYRGEWVGRRVGDRRGADLGMTETYMYV
jgi:hypothetical protein